MVGSGDSTCGHRGPVIIRRLENPVIVQVECKVDARFG